MSQTAMSAMDRIYADPILYTSYRLGILKTRLTLLRTTQYPDKAEVREMEDLEEEMFSLNHLHDLLTKGK